MPTWCHMFNSTLIGAARVWFDELPPKSINGYKDLKATFLAYFIQQKKYVKDPVEIHNIKQRDGETIEDFMERFKTETGRMKGALECMRISGFMHGVNNPELTKRLNEHVPKTMEEMMITTTTFIRGKAASASKKKGHVSWKAHDQSKRKTSDKRSDFRGHSRGGRGSNRFTPSQERRKKSWRPRKLKKQIEELVQVGKLSHLIKEIKQGRDQSKIGKKETAVKDKPTTIYMVQSWQRTVKQKKLSYMPEEVAVSCAGGSLASSLGTGREYLKIRTSLSSGHQTRSNFCINNIIGRPGLKAIQAVPSTVHGMLKFPVEGGIVTICSTILIPTECASVITSSVIPSEERTCPANFKVALHPDFPDQEVAIGGTLSDKGRTELCSILKKNLDIFAWQPSDMTGVPRWRMCVDFTDLNKACPQDCYPLPEIDWKVESLYGYSLKCFLDAYKGYHQIQLAEVDEEKTAFHTGHGVYCYTKMPFGLKNAGATYQRLMDKAFEGQIRRNIEVYVDDLVVKSYTEAEMMRDIEETFRTLHKVNMKLNLKKCSFGLAEGVFLGYVVTPEGIKPCPNKTAAVLQLPSPRTIKEVQSLNGKLASLNRFLSKSAEKSLPLFQTLKIVTFIGPRRWNKPSSKFTYALRFQFTASNNEAEYEALVAGLRIAARIGVQNVQVSVDSKLVANQVLGMYVAKEDNMVKYLEIVKSLVSRFTTFSISQVPRSKNKKADALSKIASTSFAHLSKQVLVEVLENKSIKEKEVSTVIEEDGPTWMIQLVDYLKGGVLPGDKKEARKIRLKARQYGLLEEVLYRRSFLTPWLRCVGPLQAEYVIREIHEGSCSMHAGPRSVVAKAIRLGYYWPTMHKDARDMIRKCSDCPFSEGPGKVKFLIVAMDYFMKWIEAKAVVTITGRQVKKFVWDNIVCHFGIPSEIISDNGKQFSDNPFKDWCDKLHITQRFASVKHPQSNRLVERANRSLREGIKSRLREGNKNWVEELPHVLWAHRTMIKSSHDDTPFSLTYESEAVIPTEIGMPTYRTAVVDVVNNDEELRLNLDLLEERQECAAICEAKSKSKMMKYYNARVRDIAFKLGDFVYRSNDASHAVAGGKLGPKWEGPYEVTEALGNGAYKLRSMDGTILPRTWNIANLKRCYL
nr:reverse transcriptase domain-containing protein [Tanacetum cinerariifolium]